MLQTIHAERSLRALEKSIALVESGLATPGQDLFETLRAGVIQQFEVTYELCWKLMDRWLRANRRNNHGDPETARTRKELFRAAWANQLISNPGPWFEYAEARNLTAHTYNNEQADKAYQLATRFVQDAQDLLGRLKAGDA
jgi:nucleotidyltransferase substrate binding protein (TIGR01987 family)